MTSLKQKTINARGDFSFIFGLNVWAYLTSSSIPSSRPVKSNLILERLLFPVLNKYCRQAMIAMVLCTAKEMQTSSGRHKNNLNRSLLRSFPCFYLTYHVRVIAYAFMYVLRQFHHDTYYYTMYCHRSVTGCQCTITCYHT